MSERQRLVLDPEALSWEDVEIIDAVANGDARLSSVTVIIAKASGWKVEELRKLPLSDLRAAMTSLRDAVSQGLNQKN